jgi:amino acid adenylation domain-containing protein
MMISEQYEEAVQFWLDEFRLGHFASSFPPDRRPLTRTCIPGHAAVFVGSEAWSKFTAVCNREQLNVSYALTGLLHILIHRYTVADSIGIGLQCGALLPVSAEIAGAPSVRASLLTSSHAAVAARAKACSGEDIQALSAKIGTSVEQPLFRVLLSTTDLLGSLRSAEMADEVPIRCDLVISVRERDGDTELLAAYESDVYKEDTVQRILSQFAFLIESLERLLDQPVDRVQLCSADQAKSFIEEISTQTKSFAVSRCMHQRFEEQVRKTPNAIALVMPGEPREEISYAQLNASANRLARHLVSRGVGPDVLVGLYLNRTPDLIVGLLAILKAGAAYLPIDLSYPADRVAFMLSDAEAPVVITDSRTANNLAQSTTVVICVDTDAESWAGLSSENLRSNVTPDNLAYSIFTSGSTGKPKGVLITHANVSRLFDATEEWFHFNEQDSWTFFHSSAFDFSVWEIWGALIYGGRLVIVPFADSRSPEQFHKLLASEGVTVLNQTPSAFRQLIGVDEKKPNEKLDQLRLVIFGGEALNLQSLAPWFNKYGDTKPELVNMYGITETTVHVTYRPLRRSDLKEAPGSVIGIPIPDLQLYVLDAALQPVPIGIPGEMFVGGAGVARGYLKRETLTAERFISNPFSASVNEKLYRSGDLARRLPGGDLEYMGRADQQVKIRGFRIELGEVQSALTKQPTIREAFVTVKETCSAEKFLVAYVVPASGQVPAIDKLRRDLQATLPSYMVPSSFVFLERLPLTSNGKIDRAALPSVSSIRFEMEQPFQAPQTEMERRIAAIYGNVLKIDKVGIDDNFFDLGGNSLSLVEVHSRLQDVVGGQFSVAELFAYTTVRKLAARFSHNGQAKDAQSHVLNRAQRQRQAIGAGRDRRRQ